MKNLHLLIDCMYECGRCLDHLKMLQPPCGEKVVVAADVCVFEAPEMLLRTAEKVEKSRSNGSKVHTHSVVVASPPRQQRRAASKTRTQSRGASVTRKTTHARDVSPQVSLRRRCSSKKAACVASAPSQILGAKQGFRLRSSSFKRLEMQEKVQHATSPQAVPLQPRTKSAGRSQRGKRGHSTERANADYPRPQKAQSLRVKAASCAYPSLTHPPVHYDYPEAVLEKKVSRSALSAKREPAEREERFRSTSPSVSCLSYRRLVRREVPKSLVSSDMG